MSLQRARTYVIFLALLWLCAPAFAQGPAQVGRWDAPRAWPIVGIHAAVLPTGEVFNLTYIDETTELLTGATVWNPATGRFRDVSPGFGDMFCSGQNFLADGTLFVAGGYGGLAPGKCKAQGIKPTYLFDPFSSAWRSTGDMRYPRFYPTVIALADGKQLIIGGQGEECQYIPVMEKFDPATGLSRVNGPNRLMRDYPRVFLLSNGSLVHVSPESITDIIEGSLKSWRPLTGTQLGQNRWEGAAFYVPGQQDRVMLCGGYMTNNAGDFDDPTATCEILDPLAGNPLWRPAAPLHQERGDLNAVLLPDGNVLVVGGGAHHRYEGPDLKPELYDPLRDTWTVMAPQRYGRMYHSTAVLLPDGRVLSTGQDDDGSGDGEVSGAWGEVFSPPYLFKGARPNLSNLATSADYGTSFTFTVTQAASIRKVVLMGLSTVTHSTNVGQRYVPLEFSRAGGARINAKVPDNRNLLPPGYYLLFAVNAKGVPSPGQMFQVTVPCSTLTLEHSPSAGGDDPAASPSRSSECSTTETYAEGAQVKLTGRPADGFEVASWTGTDNDGSTKGTNTVTMSEDKTVTVEYAELAPSCYKLVRTRSNKSGGANPTADPTMTLECAAPNLYYAGTRISLTAEPASGFEVARWRGTDADGSTSTDNQATMPAAKHNVDVSYKEVTTSFGDSFEDGALCAWIGRVCADCDVPACQIDFKAGSSPGAIDASQTDSTGVVPAPANHLEHSQDKAMDLRFSLKSVYEAGSKGGDYLIDTTPGRSGGEGRYAASFWINPEPGLVIKGSRTIIFQADQIAPARRIFEVFLKPAKGQKDRYALMVQARTDKGARVKLPVAEIAAGAWQHVRIAWNAASLAGASDGRIALQVDAGEEVERPVPNGSLRLDQVRFGQVKGKKRPTRGVVYFDLFESGWSQ